MVTAYKYKKMSWIDVESPTVEEVKSLMKKYFIHPLVAEEMLKPTLRPKVDIYKDSIYLILHFPIFDQTKKTSTSQEIDFVLGKNFLITAHYNTIIPLHEIIKLFEVGSILEEENLSKNTGVLVFFVVRQLYNFALRQLDHIQLKIEEIEENIFGGHEKEMVEKISMLRRDMLNFQKAIYGHQGVLSSFAVAGKRIFGPDFVHYTDIMNGELLRIKSIMENCRHTIESLQDTNDSLLTDKVNDIMRNLTVVSFITFPLMLFAALFGMSNLISTPIVGARGDFWIILGMMFVGASTMFFVFKRKKWI